MSQAVIVAFYARVSSDQQAKRGTIESQIAALTERIVADGVHVAEDMRFVDAGVSGATLIRPQLERLRDRAALGLADRLYVLSPDRLSRKYAHQALLMEELSVRRAGRVPQSCHWCHAGRVVVAADAGHDRGVRTGQNYGTQSSRQASWGQTRQHQCAVDCALRLSLHSQAA